ncbi:hypothetical protein TNIN_359751 [Trichonephila inaurata madagascariensis]|uniref:Uncharacterized protein n=1 Tax=Trichonephila inaurata madagascariensis TaxID=2747483 RepID=A0A8X6Y4R9_9ARAC|nr:hypothetical protein TNIN_359751 [Trichonephila inaurata madagascariensis]
MGKVIPQTTAHDSERGEAPSNHASSSPSSYLVRKATSGGSVNHSLPLDYHPGGVSHHDEIYSVRRVMTETRNAVKAVAFGK